MKCFGIFQKESTKRVKLLEFKETIKQNNSRFFWNPKRERERSAIILQS